ncbi:MAG: hypothetical protein WD022_02500 [Balneolaceae bacterium]
MKPTITLISGFFGLLFFEGFARLIITFYHRIDFHFYGISHLPSDVWIYVIFASVIISTWLVTMLILTVINKNSLVYSAIFGGIILSWRGIEIANSYHSEPFWYFGIVIFLHMLGIFLAYQLFNNQHEITANS